MDYKYINQLLDRYWQGETSLEEEQILRAFFSQLCVPEELAKYRPLFNYEQTATKTDCLSDDFDERLMAMIDADSPKEVTARKIQISQRFRPLFKAAAMVAIVLTLSQAAQLSFQSTGQDTVQGTVQGVQNSYAARPDRQGMPVAVNDSAHTDTIRRGTFNAMQPQLSQQHDAVILK